MYAKDKRQRITLRLTEEQMNFIDRQVNVLGISPSDYLRMLVNGVMYVERNGISPEQSEAIKEVCGRENDETLCDH